MKAARVISINTPRSPQLEDGFTRIANELFDAILAGPLTGRESLIAFGIVRKTYGFNKKEDDISASQLGKLCQMSRPHVTAALNSLARKNVITKRLGIHGCIIGIQKDYTQWGEDPLYGTKRTPHANIEGYHYTYKVTNDETGEFYIGVRTCKCLPAQDRYKGSGQWVTISGKKQLSKIITGQYATREDARKSEQEQIQALIGNPMMKNIVLFRTGTTRTESEQGVHISDITRTDSDHVDRTESVHTKDNLSKDNQKKTRKMNFRAFLADCKEKNVKPIPEDHKVFAYAIKAGIPEDFLRLQWLEFRDRYQDEDDKKYFAWATVFSKSVRGNWYKLWFARDDGAYELTTTGKQAARLHGRTA